LFGLKRDEEIGEGRKTGEGSRREKEDGEKGEETREGEGERAEKKNAQVSWDTGTT
jgi:hypothetical protein